MRGSVMLGIALIVVGAVVYLRGGSFTTRREVLKVGDVSVSAEERSPIAPWAAGLAVLAGIVLVTTGVRRKA
jgi:drug/metabolite transporter (DMT)-like permease